MPVSFPSRCPWCGERGIHRVAYEDTEHYRVMHDFIAHPQRMLAILMGQQA